MGAAASKVLSLDDIPGSIGTYGREMSDAFLAITRVLCDLRRGLDRQLSVLFDDDEAKKFYDLELSKTESISEIEDWVRKQRARYQVARSRLTDPNSSCDEKIAAANQFFSTCGVDEKIDVLVEKLNALRNDYKLFGNRLEAKYANSSKAKLAKGVVALSYSVALGIILLLHFAPGFNFALAPLELLAVSTGATFMGTTAIVALSKDEFQRTEEYLKNVENRLRSLRQALRTLQEEHEKGIHEKGHVENCVKVLDCILMRCDKLIEIADEA